MDKDDRGSERHSLSSPLFKSVSSPIDVRHRFGYGTGAGLIEQRHTVCEPEDLNGAVRGYFPSVDYSRFYDERVSVGRFGCACDRCGIIIGTESVEDVHKALLDQCLADRRETVCGRGHDLDLLYGFEDVLEILAGEFVGFRFRFDLCLGEDLVCDPVCDPGEIVLQERLDRFLLGVGGVFHQVADLHPFWMGFDLLRFRREFVGRPFEYVYLAVGVVEFYTCMGVDDRRLFEIFEDGLLTGDIPSFGGIFDAGPVFLSFPCECLIVGHYGAVGLRVHGYVHLPCDLVLAFYLGPYMRRFSGVDVPEHDGRGDTDTLLSSGLPQCVEPRTVQETSEYVRDHLVDDTGTVVFLVYDIIVVIVAVTHLDDDVREETRFLAGVQ